MGGAVPSCQYPAGRQSAGRAHIALVGWRDSEFRGVPALTPLTAFGLFAVTAMVVCYALEHRSPAFILAFAGACLLGSIYGFLQGAWPFGAVELIWSAIAVGRWRKARR
jgi:hypothetical protein